MRNQFKLATLATIIFILITWRVNFPLIADDYGFALQGLSPDFNLRSFGPLLIHRPIASIVNFFIFKHRLYDHSKVLMTTFFFLHAFGFLGIANWLTANLSAKSSISKPVTKNLVSWQVCLIILCLYPSFHEVLYMTLNLPYSLGTFFLSGMLWSSQYWLRILFMILAFCSLETYVLPMLIIPLTPILINISKLKNFDDRVKLSIHVILWSIAFLIYFGIRWALEPAGDPWIHGLQFSLGNFLEHLKVYTNLLWTLHFYKEYWIFTLLEWIAFAITGIYLVTTKEIGKRETLILLFLPSVASFHAFLMDYYAPRAIHGAVVFKLAIIGYLLYLFCHKATGRWLQLMPACILLTAYFGLSNRIFEIKTANAFTLQQKEQVWAEKMAQCHPRPDGTPCTLTMGNLGADLKRDWTLPAYSYESFLMWVKAKNKIDKPIIFRH